MTAKKHVKGSDRQGIKGNTFTGKPCVKCGSVERYLYNNKKCVACCQHNARERYHLPLTPEQSELAVDMYTSGVDVSRICKRLIRSALHVKHALVKAGVIHEKYLHCNLPRRDKGRAREYSADKKHWHYTPDCRV